MDLERALSDTHPPENPIPTEAQLFRSQLGDAWGLLSPNIQSRFERDPPPGTVIRYRGIMEQVRCSMLGKLFGFLVQKTGALMPFEGTDIQVTIDVWTQAGEPDVFKRRVYYFPGRSPFVFQSRMRLEKDGALTEFVGGGLGMRVVVRPIGRDLEFSDRGFFLALGPIRLPIPRLLSLGYVRLLHEDLGPAAFRITIEIRHPWWGLLFYQRGTFQHV